MRDFVTQPPVKTENYLLYRECFPEDSEKCVDFMFANYYPENSENFCKFSDDGKLASEFFLVRKMLIYRNNPVKIGHIAGLCTSPEKRNKGYARELLTDVLKTTDMPLVTLFPAVTGFYEKFGFTAISRDYRLPQGEKGADIGAESVSEIYNNFVSPLDFYFYRDGDSFDISRAIYNVDGAGYSLLNDGVLFPDGYFPKSYYPGEKSGVMGRITDVIALVKATKLTITEPLTIIDPIIPKNNVTFISNGGEVEYCKEGTEISVTCFAAGMFGEDKRYESVFGKVKGFLLDKY